MKIKPFTTYITKTTKDAPSLLINDLLTPLKMHPVVVFYDEYAKEVYFLAGRSQNHHTQFSRKKHNDEYLLTIKANKRNDFFINHSTYIDTSTIYSMPEDDFMKFFELNKREEIKNYYTLKDNEILSILKIMHKNFKRNLNDINLRLVEVEYNHKANKVEHKGLFVSKNYLQNLSKYHPFLDEKEIAKVKQEYKKKFIHYEKANDNDSKELLSRMLSYLQAVCENQAYEVINNGL